MGEVGQWEDKEPPAFLWPEQTLCGCQLPGVAHVYLVISGGGALRSWLWHLGPQHPEILT